MRTRAKSYASLVLRQHLRRRYIAHDPTGRLGVAHRGLASGPILAYIIRAGILQAAGPSKTATSCVVDILIPSRPSSLSAGLIPQSHFGGRCCMLVVENPRHNIETKGRLTSAAAQCGCPASFASASSTMSNNLRLTCCRLA